jgi:hypothetical protein
MFCMIQCRPPNGKLPLDSLVKNMWAATQRSQRLSIMIGKVKFVLSAPRLCKKGSKKSLRTRAGRKQSGKSNIYFTHSIHQPSSRFKLHLRPRSASSSDVTTKIPALPLDKTVVDLFADFMKYLYDCTRTYIQETHASGTSIWTSAEKNGDIDFILTHPNGWEGAQQARMRSAAVQAGLVPDTVAGRARIHFVTEGEASLHFCIQSGLTTTAMEVSWQFHVSLARD